jgi:hypothetical protein
MSRPSRNPSFYHCNIWLTVKFVKLLIMQFSAPSCHFTTLMSKYSPQHPLLRLTWSVSFT